MTLESTIAGSWYPGNEREIRALAEKWEMRINGEKSAPPIPDRPNVLLMPHAGWAYSGEIAWRTARLVRGAKYSRVVILAPSHRAWIENRLVAPEAEAVSTPLGKISIDREWLDRLALMAPVARNNRIHAAEHSAQIEYPLLQLALGDGFTLVPLVMGSFGRDQMAMCARALARLMDDRTLLVISSDFTHYGKDFSYAPYGTSGGEDVRAKVASVDGEAFSFMASRDADGFAAYVGNTAAVGRVEWPGEGKQVLDVEARAYLLRIARESMESAVKGVPYSRPPFPVRNSPVAAKMGAFVTLSDRATGALRGCIGEIMPMRPLDEAVVKRAVDSALHDPRFMPVAERELSGIRVEVSALTPPKPVASWRDIVLGRDGMTLEKDGAFAVFLPQVAPMNRGNGERGRDGHLRDMPTTLQSSRRRVRILPRTEGCGRTRGRGELRQDHVSCA